MFRARRFGAPAPQPKSPKPATGGRPVNDAQAFQTALFRRALEERGPQLERFKGQAMRRGS